jgi:hypothetical protein
VAIVRMEELNKLKKKIPHRVSSLRPSGLWYGASRTVRLSYFLRGSSGSKRTWPLDVQLMNRGLIYLSHVVLGLILYPVHWVRTDFYSASKAASA